MFSEFFKIATTGQFAGYAWANETQLQNKWATVYAKFVGEYGEKFAARQADGHAGKLLIEIASGQVGCAHNDWHNSGLTGAVCTGCGRRMTHSSTLGRAIPA